VLEELRVRDLGVIDDVTVAFGPGMTVLTGETGAGKTLLVEALLLLLGGRADPGLVRSGADEALVEARFCEPDGAAGGPAPDDGSGTGDGLILARAVVPGGRTRAWVDGRMAPVHLLAEAAAGHLELHGQHQHRALVLPATQRRALDRHGGIDLTGLRAAAARLAGLTAERDALGGDARERARQADLLRYQLEEIGAAAIEDGGEDARLEAEEERLAAAGALREAAASALEALSEAPSASAVDRLGEVSAALAGKAPLAGLDQRVRAAMAELADLGVELRSVVETWEDDPPRLEEVRARRQRFHELQRKYGTTLDEVVAFAGRAAAELDELEGRERRSAALDAEIAAARASVDEAAARVAAARRAAAPALADEIRTTLRQLAMPSARFEVAVAGDGPADEVTFLLGANPGEPLAPLARVASGGELARTMLAVRLALTDDPGVLVFDEVDAGIGGTAATAVGAALSALGRRTQVLVVTHLAQVAAQADHHLLVRKGESGGRTRSEVTPLVGEDRVVEVSRMLSGSPDSQSARAHARELLASAVARRSARAD
jgi:DNA repair protein RecN (Recombination protein N)